MSSVNATGVAMPKITHVMAKTFMKKIKRKNMEPNIVDQIWIEFKERVSRTPASLVFNLKPAGFPVNRAQLISGL